MSSSADVWGSAIRQGGGGRGGSNGLNYPSPYLNFEKYNLPKTVKEVFEFVSWCYISDSSIKPVIENMSTYPITTLIYEHTRNIEDRDEREKIQKAWEVILDEKLDIRVFCSLMSIDYNGLGNAFASVYMPFTRYLICQKCGAKHNIHLSDTQWRWQDFEFQLICNGKCGKQKAKVKDEPRLDSTAINEVNFVRWNPNQIELKKHKSTGRMTIKYRLSLSEKQEIIDGDPEALKYSNIEFIDAVAQNAKNGRDCTVTFDPTKVFVMQTSAMSMPGDGWNGWGIPKMIASLRDVVSRNNIRRAESMVLHEHTIPLRIFTPLTDEGGKPMLGVAQWRGEIINGYKKWQKDPSTIITSPVGLNVQQLGGDRGALTLFAEKQQTGSDIVTGMGVPLEFAKGSLSYSGGNVSIRMLENILMDCVNKINRFVNWVIEILQPIVKVEKVKAKFKPFKMADDIQQKQLLFSARQAKEISHNQFCQMMDLDSQTELNAIAKENMTSAFQNALAQTKSALSMQRLQEYNSKINNSLTTDYDNIIDPALVTQYVEQISSHPIETQMQFVEELKKTQPVLGGLVLTKLDLTPAGLENALKVIMTTPEPFRTEALKDLMRTNPTVANMFNMMSSVQLNQQQQSPPLFGQPQQAQQGKPAQQQAGHRPVSTSKIKPNPEQKPPRSQYAGI